jgi:hypothetical protein
MKIADIQRSDHCAKQMGSVLKAGKLWLAAAIGMGISVLASSAYLMLGRGIHLSDPPLGCRRFLHRICGGPEGLRLGFAFGNRRESRGRYRGWVDLRIDCRAGPFDLVFSKSKNQTGNRAPILSWRMMKPKT